METEKVLWREEKILKGLLHSFFVRVPENGGNISSDILQVCILSPVVQKTRRRQEEEKEENKTERGFLWTKLPGTPELKTLPRQTTHSCSTRLVILLLTFKLY